MTTDILVTLRDQQGRLSLLALSCKYEKDTQSKRVRQLLSLEREYWSVREVPWLLITEALFDEAVALTLRRVICWAFGDSCPPQDLRKAVEFASRFSGRSMTFMLQRLSDAFGSMDHAQRAFYQAVWEGQIPLDLRRSWRNHTPPVLLSQAAFVALNPVASRRTAWT